MKSQSATSTPVVPTGLPELLRPRDVAKMLALSSVRVYQLAQTQEIPSIKIGKSIRFDPRDVAEFVRSCRRERRGTP